jgi:hypothetical protein
MSQANARPLSRAAEGPSNGLGDLADVLLDGSGHRAVEGAHRAAEPCRTRHDAVGLARVNLGHRQHRAVDWPQPPRDDGLQRQRDLRRGQQGIGAVVRHGRVALRALHLDLEEVARSHERARAQCDAPQGQAWPVVHAEDGVHGEALEQSVLDHGPGACAALLRRLEDEMHGAAEGITMRRQIARGSEQHRHVAVMAAGMHDAGIARAVREGVGFLDGQCVHVGTQADRRAARSPDQGADDARLADASRDVDTPGFERLANDFCGLVNLVAQFRARVEALPQRADRCVVEGGVVGIHEASLSVVPARDQAWAAGLNASAARRALSSATRADVSCRTSE